MTSAEAIRRDEIAQLLQQNWVRAARAILTAVEPLLRDLPRRPTQQAAWDGFDRALLKSLRKWPCMRDNEKANFLADADAIIALLKDLGELK